MEGKLERRKKSGKSGGEKEGREGGKEREREREKSGGRSPYSKSPSTAFNYDVIANTDDGYFLRYTLYVTFAMRREAGRRQRRFSVQS